jgi:hypothetical protein
MTRRKKDGILYKGYLLLSPDHISGGMLEPALQVSHFYLEDGDGYQTKQLTAGEEIPDIRLGDGHTLYIPSESRDQVDGTAFSILLEIFQAGRKPKAADTRNLVFKSRIRPEHQAALQEFSQNKVQALLYCAKRPPYHKLVTPLQAIAPTG